MLSFFILLGPALGFELIGFLKDVVVIEVSRLEVVDCHTFANRNIPYFKISRRHPVENAYSRTKHSQHFQLHPIDILDLL